ncbi:hypothetical protein GJ744_004211 [Endocarpon pusillum]|uniref:Uncharacterized protein n=1 Tax=Endocarpon pusillum TaxID=364733 RepID=A0A8H7A608_9EURO|nr:hypothetical protein GJ744_004211 [Endocarpon pusillum]
MQILQGYTANLPSKLTLANARHATYEANWSNPLYQLALVDEYVETYIAISLRLFDVALDS